MSSSDSPYDVLKLAPNLADYSPKQIDDIIYKLHCRNDKLRAKLLKASQAALRMIFTTPSIFEYRAKPSEEHTPSKEHSFFLAELGRRQKAIKKNEAEIEEFEDEKWRRMTEDVWSGPHYWPKETA